jgi:hypothetical protein
LFVHGKFPSPEKQEFDMIKKYKKGRWWSWAIPGVIFQVLSLNLGHPGLFVIQLLLATAMLIIGGAYYAKEKGRSWAWCLLGFFSIIGLIGLWLLPDLEKDASPDSLA